ncbi:MAG: hypothetical protein UX98_C0012G0008 [Parcubacteria group bacterium GW2011_GWA2_47_26]|nr:MAG: hypothetical protein UX98_C0012G0008 [Parcubacteria group bacterium GW2011_GWA2_47_26]
MKRLTDDEDAIVGVELVAEVVEVEVAVRAVHVRVGHVDVAVRVRPPKYIRYRPYHHPLSALRVESNLKTLSP